MIPADNKFHRGSGADGKHYWLSTPGTGHFPTDKFTTFIGLVDNHIPVTWLAFKCGCELVPLRSDVERQLEEANAEIQRLCHDLDVIVEYSKRVKG